MAERLGKTGRLLLWAVTGAAAAGALGWYILEDRPEPVTVRPLEAQVQRAQGAPLDVNTATAEELEALPGIGPVLAERIVAWREEHGPFAAPEDVTAVPGVGPAVYEAVRPYIEDEEEEP